MSKSKLHHHERCPSLPTVWKLLIRQSGFASYSVPFNIFALAVENHCSPIGLCRNSLVADAGMTALVDGSTKRLLINSTPLFTNNHVTAASCLFTYTPGVIAQTHVQATGGYIMKLQAIILRTIGYTRTDSAVATLEVHP